MKLPAIFLFLAAMITRAQVGAPQLGYVADGTRLRPVYGIPAAAAVLAPLDYGHNFARMAISPRQDFAIASDADSGEVLLVSAASAATIPGTLLNPDRISISPRGSAAALWFSSAGRLQIISGLPGSPSVRDVTTAFLNETPGAIAVSDDGAMAAGSLPDGLYSFGPNGEVNRIPMRERVGALAFYGASHDLALATRLQIWKVANASPGAMSSLYRADLLAPVGIALSSDNQRLTLAQSSGRILTLDLSSGAASQTDCGCSPEGVFPVGPSVFRITAFDGATFRVFDPSSGNFFFVPLAPVQQNDAQQGGAQ
ncbi:MAG TPA: hypothetical protein VH639_10445 [Bryobacteraceae bacterium]|jgi:hypothetical protein